MTPRGPTATWNALRAAGFEPWVRQGKLVLHGDRANLTASLVADAQAHESEFVTYICWRRPRRHRSLARYKTEPAA